MNSRPVSFIIMETQNDLLNFIIIDDDPINNLACRAAIKSATGGKIAKCFNNPVESLNYFEKEYALSIPSHQTIIFLDLNMPEMNGWEWLEKFSNMPEKIKERITIYILSSSVNPTDIDQAHANTLVKDYIIKPLTKAKVQDLLHETNTNPMAELNTI